MKVITVNVSPVVQQHYWRCDIALEFSAKAWSLQITDVFATSRWTDDDDSCSVVLPKAFPNMTAKALADFINSIAPCGPGYGGFRKVSAEEVRPLLQAAKDYQTEEPPCPM